MLLSQLQRLEKLRHTIRTEWITLLRQEPAYTALANPDTLVYLMDRTLDQLFRGLRRPDEKWLHSVAGRDRPLRESCRCSLSPLIVYFSTGELALRATATRRHAEDLPEILLLFHAIAHEEINSLCAVCPRSDGPGCPLGAAQDESCGVAVVRRTSATSTATPLATGR